MWDRAKVVLHHDPSIDLRHSWKEFHRLDIFNWFPKEMIPNWKPKCGTCGSSDHIKSNGCNNPPRLVFGEHENYLLNAPQRYLCRSCKKKAKDEEAAGIPKNERAKYTWLSTDDCVLDQLACEDPDIFELFPCHLAKKAGLDKECLDNIIDNVVKGVGPAASAETIARKHGARWQSKEIMWLAHLRRRREKPLLMDSQDIAAEDIAKCPEYASDELGGITPSPSWLVYMFCREVEKTRNYLDADCIKRLKTLLFVAIDASYKVSHVHE